MYKNIAEFLSHCICAIKKKDHFKKRPYSKNVLQASAVLDLCAIDIFEYDSKLYLTLMDIFSEFPFCIEIASKEQKEVTEAFLRFCALYATPKAIFSDNGPEFSQIPVQRDTTPANYPQANGKLERLHRELGKLCKRIHNSRPDVAITLLQTDLKKAIFLDGLILPPISELSEHGEILASFSSLKPEKFQMYDFVYREVQQRKRAKHQDTFTGPHMITKVLSSSTYYINSDKNYSGEIKVHYNQLKPFTIPETEHWTLNPMYLKNALHQLDLELFQGINVTINFKDLSLLTLQLLNSDIKKVFVIPEWHCAPWYKPIHGILKKKLQSVKLPNVPDLFLDPCGGPLGMFSFDHWLFTTTGRDKLFSEGTMITFVHVPNSSGKQFTEN